MKRALLLSTFLFSFLLLNAQNNVKVTITREKSFSSSAVSFAVIIDGVEKGKLKNGSTESYSVGFQPGKPLTILVRSGLAKKEISVNPKPGEEVFINTGLKGGMVTLDLVKGASVQQGTGETAGITADKKTLGVTYTSQSVNSTDTLRQQWVDKGGKLIGLSFTTAGTYTGMKMESGSFSGTGVTFNMGATFLNFKPPVNNKDGLLKWNSSIYGFMVTNQFMSTSTKVEIPGMDPEKFSTMNFNLMVSGNIGYTFGFGKFMDETKWKGVALDLTYRPSAILTLSEGGGGGSLNYLGFGVDVNFNNFTTNASRLAPKAQSKITFFMLPPIKDNPLFITLGYGVTYYMKNKR